MENWILDVIEQFGYIGVFLLITLENIFPPIPSEVILTFGGFMTTKTDLNVLGVVISSTVGSVAGAMILYALGMFLGVERMEVIVDKWGHILRLSKEDLYKANAWFLKYGVWTVFFCRFIPLIRSLISIPAGMSHMNFKLFLLLTTLGTLIWNTVLVNVGVAVGASWESVVAYIDLYSKAVYVGLAILIMIFVGVWFKKRFRN